jgi:putative molybdopterin biosynthesis protein
MAMDSKVVPGGSSPTLALSVRDAARALSLGERKLWEMTNRGEIPHVRCGKRILYPLAALEAWLAEQARKAVGE